MPKPRSKPTLIEPAKILQPGQLLIENFFNSITQLNDVNIEVAKMLQTLCASGQLSRDTILQKLAEIRSKQNG